MPTIAKCKDTTFFEIRLRNFLRRRFLRTLTRIRAVRIRRLPYPTGIHQQLPQPHTRRALGLPVPHKAVQLHLAPSPERRQRQRHHPLAPLRRRAQHPLAPLRRVGKQVDIVRAAGTRGAVSARDGAVGCGHGRPCPHIRDRQPQPLAMHRAELHSRQSPFGHQHMAVVHPLGSYTTAVEADKQIARTHAQRRPRTAQAHRHRRPHAAGQPRQQAEHPPARLLPLRPRIADGRRRTPQYGTPVTHITHHRPHPADDGSQNSLCYLSHNRIVFLPPNIRAKTENGQNRPQFSSNVPKCPLMSHSSAPLSSTPSSHNITASAPPSAGPSSELCRSCIGGRVEMRDFSV